MANDGGSAVAEYGNFIATVSAEDRDMFPDPEAIGNLSTYHDKEGTQNVKKGSRSAKNNEPKKIALGGNSAFGSPQDFGSTDAWGYPPTQAAYMQAAMMQQAMFNPAMASPWGGYWPMDPTQMQAQGFMHPMMMMQQMDGMGGRGNNAASRKKADPLKAKSGERRRRGRGQGGAAKAEAAADDAEDDANIQRSPMLEEVRKHGTSVRLELSDVLPHLVEFAQDHYGSRFLQTQLENANDADKLAVYEAILPETTALANDVFGNYVLQKLFDIGTSEQKKMLALQLQGEVLKLSKQSYGCRVVQKALQSVPRDQQVALAKELEANVIDCIEDQNGNHVIQKCIEQMPPDAVNFIIKAIDSAKGAGSKDKDVIRRMATHGYGCRVIQRLLEHCAPHQLEKILERITESIPHLIENQFGNYVIQHVLEHAREEDKRKVLEEIRRNIVEYSKKKCSSNVVEKCFEIASIGEHASRLEQDRRNLIETVLGEPGCPNPPLHEMMKDKFGNYIVQRMLEYSKGQEKERLFAMVNAQAPTLKGSSIGKHIYAALQKEAAKDPSMPPVVDDLQ